MLQEKLNEVLELHEKWLNDEEDGIKADLSYQDLSGMDLSKANLKFANLSEANLTEANLQEANLDYTNLEASDLTNSNLGGVDLTKTYLVYANLNGVKLAESKINWESHELVSELLFRAADNDSRRDAATIVYNNTHKCWDDFLAMDHPEKKWALSVLRKYMKPGEYHYALIERYCALMERHKGSAC